MIFPPIRRASGLMPRTSSERGGESNQKWQLIMVAFLLEIGVSASGAGGVVLDGKLGPAGPLSGPNYNITADLGRTVGNNLFQSFLRFNLEAGEVATFSGPANIQNIL